MKVIKLLFYLFIIFISIIFIKNNIIKQIDLNQITTITNNNIKNIFNSYIKNDDNDINKLLENKKTNQIVKNTLQLNQTKNDMKVYIYNTHNKEEYQKTIYGITPTVVDASNMIQNELLKYYVYSYVEEMDIVKQTKNEKLTYDETYTISRKNIKKIKKKYPSITYFFDIHRDSIKGASSKTTINKNNYAKVMFSIATNNKNYKENEKSVKKMEEYINKNYKGVLRKTYYPKRLYNQDIDKNVFLIELGGIDNTIEEIYNSSKVIAEAINYLNGG